MQHPNARLTPAGRRRMIALVEDGGFSYRQAAACCGVAISTVCEWTRRWRGASEHERADLSCLGDRTSTPHRSPRITSRDLQERIASARRRTGWGPRLIAGELGLPHQTVWKVLHRIGLSRTQRPAREKAVRYEWPCPGDLLHMDTSRYARFDRPGHRVTGDHVKTSAEKANGPGYDFCHAIIDDHSRLAYVELHPDERADTVTGFLKRAGLLRRARDHHPAADDRQRLDLRQQPLPARAAQREGHPPPAHQALPTADQREGGAPPPDDGPGVGVRDDLQKRPGQDPGAAILATSLQREPTAQRSRGPAADQSRSERP